MNIQLTQTSAPQVNQVALPEPLTYYCDLYRHLVCRPYSIANLHLMAQRLGVKRCWFHEDRYDIPKRRLVEVMGKCQTVGARDVMAICRNPYV